MINYSFSTMLMTFLASNLIIVLITMCFHHEKILLSIGYKVIAVFLILTLLRILFPFEMPFSENIYLPKLLSLVMGIIRHPFIELEGIGISIWTGLEVVWGIGFLVNLYRYEKDCRIIRQFHHRYGIDVTREEPYCSILAEVCGERKNDFRIMRVPALNSPMLTGIRKPCIMIPIEEELSREELYYTFRHETFHHYHRDILVKFGVGLLGMVYWWNPACKKLKEQLEQILEMRIDENVAEHDKRRAVGYMASMINIMEVLWARKQIALDSGLSLSDEESTKMQQRFRMLCGRREKVHVPLFLTLLAVMVVIYLGSYMVILEADYEPQYSYVQDTVSVPDGLYAVWDDENEVYSVYFNETFIEYVNSLECYSSEIPIFTKNQGGFCYE